MERRQNAVMTKATGSFTAEDGASNPVIDLLWARFATRSMQEDTIPESIVVELADAARLAPSAMNRQPWRYLFITSPEGRAKALATMAERNQAWVRKAPLIILGYTTPQEAEGRTDFYRPFELGMSAMNVMLAATHRGLVARPLAGFDADAARETFDLEDGSRPMIFIAVGYPDPKVLDEEGNPLPQPRERKPAQEIVSMN